MRNPWLDLPQASPYVLPEDAEPIEHFNRNAEEAHRVHLELLPEPFLGNPDAPVVLLSLNPGYSPDDAAAHADARFALRLRDNLRHRPAAYPFCLLDPTFQAPGRRWWEKRLGPLIQATSREAVARGVFCIEYFGYHSHRFGHRRLNLTSQRYGFFLVERALARGALVVCMRSRRLWVKAVPQLDEHARVCALRNPQSPYISPRNCPSDFERIVDAIQNHCV